MENVVIKGLAKPSEKVEVVKVVEKVIPSMVFPTSVKREVIIKRKSKHSPLPGYDLDDSKVKIGSSFKGATVNRGLTFDEEKRFLPSILGIDANSPNWEAETRDYWANISRDVPPLGKDGQGGLKLEVGLYYDTKEKYDADQRAVRNLNGVIENPKGQPINIADYILWRYCLVYAKVANDFSLVNASANIEFYIFTKDKDIQDKKLVLNQKREAFKIYNQNIGDREWVSWMLSSLVASDKTSKVSARDLGTITDDEKDIMLDDYLNSSPDRFIALGTDKNLQTRSFIEVCVAMGLLKRIPNTNTITLDGTPISNTIEEAIAFMSNPKNAEIFTALKAKVRHNP